MKNILWIDKDKTYIDQFFAEFLNNDSFKIFAFDNYDLALKFIKESNVQIDLVIANYCVFQWINILLSNKKTVDDTKLYYYFYDKLYETNPDLPFMLFTSMNIDEAKKPIYETRSNFHYVSKLNHHWPDIIQSYITLN